MCNIHNIWAVTSQMSLSFSERSLYAIFVTTSGSTGIFSGAYDKMHGLWPWGINVAGIERTARHLPCVAWLDRWMRSESGTHPRRFRILLEIPSIFFSSPCQDFLNTTRGLWCCIVMIMAQTKRSDDVEAQIAAKEKPSHYSVAGVDSEYNTTTRTKFAYLGVYFLCNISLTIYNKAVLGKVTRFSLWSLLITWPCTEDIIVCISMASYNYPYRVCINRMLDIVISRRF